MWQVTIQFRKCGSDLGRLAEAPVFLAEFRILKNKIQILKNTAAHSCFPYCKVIELGQQSALVSTHEGVHEAIPQSAGIGGLELDDFPQEFEDAKLFWNLFDGIGN